MKKITRRAAAVLVAAMLLPQLPAAAYSDVSDPAQAPDIAFVTERGLFQGVSEDVFAPQQPMTRAMAVTVLARLAKTAGVTDARFADVPQTAYYAAAVGWAAKNQIVLGASPSAFEPERVMTHDELLSVLNRYWTWLGRTDEAPAFASPGTSAVTRGEAASAVAALGRALEARDTKVLTHKAADGVELTGKLDLPASGTVDRIVLFVNGSGPNTYDNKRQLGEDTFQYFDLFAEQLAARGIGFFRWNTRGVTDGDEPPMFQKVDDADYKTYLPKTSVSDIGEWIDALHKEERLKDAQVYLLGWSEGTIIAPLAAKAYPEQVDGLLLAGYCNDRMNDILTWQQTGGSSMVFYCEYFDANGDGKISKEELDSDPYDVKELLGAEFEQIDADGDGALTQEDFRLMLAPGFQTLKDAISRGDDKWLAENYGVQLTSAWFKAHEQLAPNKETLPGLTLPIAIFHGTADQNCSVEGAYAIETAFEEAGKTNLTVHVYQGYDHDLNYLAYQMTGAMPQAFEDLFETCRTMK